MQILTVTNDKDDISIYQWIVLLTVPRSFHGHASMPGDVICTHVVEVQTEWCSISCLRSKF